MKRTNARFTNQAKYQIKKHEEEICQDEIEDWLNDPEIFDTKEVLQDGFCIKRIIKRPHKRQVNVLFKINKWEFVVYHVHLGNIGNPCISIKKTPSIKDLLKKKMGKNKRKYKRRKKRKFR